MLGGKNGRKFDSKRVATSASINSVSVSRQPPPIQPSSRPRRSIASSRMRSGAGAAALRLSGGAGRTLTTATLLALDFGEIGAHRLVRRRHALEEALQQRRGPGANIRHHRIRHRHHLHAALLEAAEAVDIGLERIRPEIRLHLRGDAGDQLLLIRAQTLPGIEIDGQHLRRPHMVGRIDVLHELPELAVDTGHRRGRNPATAPDASAGMVSPQGIMTGAMPTAFSMSTAFLSGTRILMFFSPSTPATFP